MRYYPETKSREEAEAWVRRVRRSYGENGLGLGAAVLKNSGEFAGRCGIVLQEVDGREEAEVGYLFLRKFWGWPPKRRVPAANTASSTWATIGRRPLQTRPTPPPGRSRRRTA